MQKKIIALAVAGLMSGAAFAQSNVTIYGGMDLSIVNLNPAGAAPSYNVVLNNAVYASRLGFKGTEDLGNGLKAYFVLENGLTSDAPNNAFGDGARQSYIGLSGAFGAVQLGRQSSLSHAWSGKYDYAGNFTGAILGGLRGAATSDGVTHNHPNTLAYLSPNFSGFTLGFAHQFDEVGGTNSDVNQFGANYENGPIAATYVYTSIGPGAGTRQRANFLAASYDFGVAKVMGEYTDRKAKNAASKGSFWMLGVAAPVSAAGTVHVGYSRGKNAADAAAGLSDKNFSIAYTHGLSKRTTAYAGFMKGSGNGTVATTLDNTKAIGAGMIHKF